MGCDKRKKRRELETFEQFRRAYAVPDGVVDWEGENPDVVVHAADRRVGIDITSICHAGGPGGSPAMAVAGEREDVIRLLREELERVGVPPVDVSVHFNGPLRFRSRGRRAFANHLASYVAARVPEVGEVFSSCATTWPIDKDLPAQVSAIKVARYPCLTRMFCKAPGYVAVPDLQAIVIEQRVAGKNCRVATYRERCDETWLVMCINTADLGTWHSLDESATSAEVATEFDRLFLFSVLDHYACEIRRAGHTPPAELVTT